MPEVSDERLRNARAWAQALCDLSGAEVIVAACDEALAARRESFSSALEAIEVANRSASWFNYCSLNDSVDGVARVTIDGQFTRDQLRAIVYLMSLPNAAELLR